MGLMKWLGLDLGPEAEPIEITDQNFRTEVGESSTPVLIDVWSPGCAPCNALAPTIRRLAAKYNGKVKVAHLNAAAHRGATSKLRVRGTPTVVLFHQGRELERVVGVRPQIYFEEMLDDLFGIEERPN